MKITDRHRLAAALLADGASEREAARQVGVSHVAVGRWRKLPEFEALVTERKQTPRPELSQVRDNWRVAIKDEQALGGWLAVQYLLRACHPEAPISPHGINAAKILMEKANVAALAPEVEAGPETPEEQVAVMWTFPIEVLAAVLALKTANRWKAPSDDEIRDALKEARVH